MSGEIPLQPQASASAKQRIKEIELNAQRTIGWSVENSRANQYLTQLIPNFNKNLITALAKVVSTHLNIPLDREAQRNKTICIKWFDENFNAAKEFIDKNICVLDKDYQKMGHQTPESQEIELKFKSQKLEEQ